MLTNGRFGPNLVAYCQQTLTSPWICSPKSQLPHIPLAACTCLQEVLPAMKLVKYYAWERFFEDKIATIRNSERRLMIWNCAIKVINVSDISTTTHG